MYLHTLQQYVTTKTVEASMKNVQNEEYLFLEILCKFSLHTKKTIVGFSVKSGQRAFNDKIKYYY